MRERERDRQTERQRERQTERQRIMCVIEIVCRRERSLGVCVLVRETSLVCVSLL